MPDLKTELRQMTITVVEEQHQAVFRRVEALEQACCQPFAEEYGTHFRLLPDGSLVPAALYIERQKMGKTVMDKPKIGWQLCPYCGVRLVAEVKVVSLTGVSGPTQNPEPETQNPLPNV